MPAADYRILTDATGQRIAEALEDMSVDRAAKTDLTFIIATGTTNQTGATITAGTYFYLNGTLVQAKTDIASDATFTSGTNYEAVTAGGLNALNAQIANLKYTTVTINQSAQSSRGTVTGKYKYNATEVMINIIFTASVTLSNSPGLIAFSSYKPAHDCAFSCIDITSGITSAITSSVPCGIGTIGTIFIKECTENHIYAISGTYIRA